MSISRLELSDVSNPTEVISQNGPQEKEVALTEFSPERGASLGRFKANVVSHPIAATLSLQNSVHQVPLLGLLQAIDQKSSAQVKQSITSLHFEQPDLESLVFLGGVLVDRGMIEEAVLLMEKIDEMTKKGARGLFDGDFASDIRCNILIHLLRQGNAQALLQYPQILSMQLMRFPEFLEVSKKGLQLIYQQMPDFQKAVLLPLIFQELGDAGALKEILSLAKEGAELFKRQFPDANESLQAIEESFLAVSVPSLLKEGHLNQAKALIVEMQPGDAKDFALQALCVHLIRNNESFFEILSFIKKIVDLEQASLCWLEVFIRDILRDYISKRNFKKGEIAEAIEIIKKGHPLLQDRLYFTLQDRIYFTFCKSLLLKNLFRESIQVHQNVSDEKLKQSIARDIIRTFGKAGSVQDVALIKELIHEYQLQIQDQELAALVFVPEFREKIARGKMPELVEEIFKMSKGEKELQASLVHALVRAFV